MTVITRGRGTVRTAVFALALVAPVLVVSAPAHAAVPTALHVNFQPASVSAPAGYTKDTGVAFNGTSGWQTEAGAALDMTGNTRVRNSAQSPDVRYDTQVLMQETSTSTGNRYDVVITWWAAPAGMSMSCRVKRSKAGTRVGGVSVK